MVAAMRDFEQAGGWLCEEQTIAKARSSLCTEAFDLHLYPVGSPYWGHGGSWTFMFPVATMTPLSRGTMRLSGRDPEAPPIIDHAYLTDPEGRDIEVLLDGVELTHSLVAQEPLVGLAGPEIRPGPEIRTRHDLRRYAQANCVHYYHPVGTCKMGPASDPMAVVDAAGHVHGLDGLLVADAAIMPVIPRANTNIPSAVIGEKIAALLLNA
jgi:choline dehydrogenase